MPYCNSIVSNSSHCVYIILTYVGWVVEAQTSVKSRNRLDLVIGEVEIADIQVRGQSGLVVGLWNDSDLALSSPSQEYLSWGLAVLVGDLLDGFVLEQKRGVLGTLHIELVVGNGTEGGVGGHCNAVLLNKIDKRLLREVWVVLDLKSGGVDLCIAEEVQKQRTVVV